MAKMEITVSVEKETYEVGKFMAEILMSIKAKKPIAQIAAEELTALSAAVDGIQNIPAEFSEDQAAFMKAVLNPVADAVGALLKKDPAAPAQAPSA
jgi:hypothetical protein